MSRGHKSRALIVSKDYDILRCSVGTGEPGHTFILLDEDDVVICIRDYGAPENVGKIHVPLMISLNQSK